MRYTFRYRRCSWFPLPYRSIFVAGHRFDQVQGKMVLYFADGSQRELGNWLSYECKLGVDWVLENKKEMERAAGQPVVLDV